jgi:hypothetical protein
MRVPQYPLKRYLGAVIIHLNIIYISLLIFNYLYFIHGVSCFPSQNTKLSNITTNQFKISQNAIAMQICNNL